MPIFFDIYSKGDYPSNQLSNFAHHPLTFDGVYITSAESFLQSLKAQDALSQKKICGMDARSAKELSPTLKWQSSGLLHWREVSFSRYGPEYQDLLTRFYDTLAKNDQFADALLATGHRPLWHNVGRFFRHTTCLTTFEFLGQLYRVRKNLRTQHKNTHSL